MKHTSDSGNEALGHKLQHHGLAVGQPPAAHTAALDAEPLVAAEGVVRGVIATIREVAQDRLSA